MGARRASVLLTTFLTEDLYWIVPSPLLTTGLRDGALVAWRACGRITMVPRVCHVAGAWSLRYRKIRPKKPVDISVDHFNLIRTTYANLSMESLQFKSGQKFFKVSI